MSAHPIKKMLRDLAASLSRTISQKLVQAQEELWTRAVPEQQRLTIQLCRNSLYFLLSSLLIGIAGDQLAL